MTNLVVGSEFMYAFFSPFLGKGNFVDLYARQLYKNIPEYFESFEDAKAITQSLFDNLPEEAKQQLLKVVIHK